MPSWNAVICIKGFGRSYTSNLVKWKKQIEKKFQFDPAKGIDPEDLNRLKKKYIQKQKRLQGELLAGPEQLMSIEKESQKQRQILYVPLKTAAKRVAQAKADMKAS